jgi:hypothetical protein
MEHDLVFRVLRGSSLFLDARAPFTSIVLHKVHWLAALATFEHSDWAKLLSVPPAYSPSCHNGDDSVALVTTIGNPRLGVCVVSSFAVLSRHISIRGQSMDVHIKHC